MNRFIESLVFYKQVNSISFRSMALSAGISVTHLIDVIHGRSPLTMNICRKLAINVLKIDILDAFELAGFLSDREAVK